MNSESGVIDHGKSVHHSAFIIHHSSFPNVDIVRVHQRIVATFAGADADDIVDRIDEDDTIAFISCPCSLGDCFDGLFDIVVAEHDVDLDLGDQVHVV